MQLNRQALGRPLVNEIAVIAPVQEGIGLQAFNFYLFFSVVTILCFCNFFDSLIAFPI